VLATASPTDKVGQAEVAGEEDPELALLDDGATPLDERRTLLASARQTVGSEPPIAFILGAVKSKTIKAAGALFVLRKLVSGNLTGGYKLDARETNRLGEGRRLEINYTGLHALNMRVPKVERVGRGPSNPLPVGLAYIKAVATTPTGEDPVEALGLDFLVSPTIEAVGVVGVGTQMMQIAAAHFHTEYQAVVGEWYTGKFYASKSGKREALSDNLKKYIDARKAGKSEEEAAKTTWTYRRVKEIYGGAELELRVRELVPDLDNLPSDAQIVEVLMKPK
jgi:hypothetical protein